MRLRNRVPMGLVAVAGLLWLALLTAACAPAGPQNTLDAKGHIAAVTASLFWPVFWIAVGVFILVEGLLLFIAFRYRDRGRRQLPVQTHGNTRLEVTWTAIPTILLIGIAIPTIATLVHVNTTPPDALEINVIGHQWWWEYDYPKQGVITADELHIPAGVPVHVNLSSADVVHSFWVPPLVGKQDVIPNHPGGMWFSAYEPGTYYGQCAQFCGEEHALMQLRVIAQSQDDFNAWLSSQQTHAAITLPAAFESNGCSGCHTIAGTSAQGKVGPDLTHFASRTWFEEMENNPENVRRWITDPQGVKPGNDMKIGKLSPQDTETLVNFLGSLK